MRLILNFLVTFVLFWIGNEYFNEYIAIKDMKTIIIATLFMFVISYLWGYAFMLSFFLIPLGIGCLTTPILWIATIILTPIKLWLLDKYLPGFEIHGFWTYVILTVVLYMFSIKSKNQVQQQTNSQ